MWSVSLLPVHLSMCGSTPMPSVRPGSPSSRNHSFVNLGIYLDVVSQSRCGQVVNLDEGFAAGLAAQGSGIYSFWPQHMTRLIKHCHLLGAMGAQAIWSPFARQTGYCTPLVCLHPLRIQFKNTPYLCSKMEAARNLFVAITQNSQVITN